jgi:histidinol-phosphate aminotransferase
MTPYPPGKPIEETQRELGLTDVIKLASNENPFGPSPAALEAVAAAAKDLHLYPDARGWALKQAIGEQTGADPGQILLGNGSDELLHYLGMVFLGSPEDEVIVGHPSFVRYGAVAEAADCKLVTVPLDTAWRHDLTAMAAAVTERTRLVFIADPNNPTGTTVARRALESFLSDLPETTVTVLDQAYAEFAADGPGYADGLTLLRAGHRVVSLRTLSKAHGLAGIRLGYGFADPEVVDAVDRVREPFNVNSLAQAAAIAALKDSAHVQETVRRTRDGLRRMTDAVEALGFRAIPSSANFLCFDLGVPSEPAFQALLEQGVIVRPGGPLGMPTFLRVSVGTESEVDRFLAAFTEVARRLGLSREEARA